MCGFCQRERGIASSARFFQYGSALMWMQYDGECLRSGVIENTCCARTESIISTNLPDTCDVLVRSLQCVKALRTLHISDVRILLKRARGFGSSARDFQSGSALVCECHMLVSKDFAFPHCFVHFAY